VTFTVTFKLKNALYIKKLTLKSFKICFSSSFPNFLQQKMVFQLNFFTVQQQKFDFKLKFQFENAKLVLENKFKVFRASDCKSQPSIFIATSSKMDFSFQILVKHMKVLQFSSLSPFSSF